MARRAVRDTFGFERIGDVQVRRQIMAGDLVPVHIIPGDETAIATDTGFDLSTVIGEPAEVRRVTRAK